MPLGEAAAVLNAVFWAATGVAAKTLGPAVRPYHIITAHTLVASAVFIVVAAVTGNIDELAKAPAAALLLFSAAALLNTVGSFIFFTAVSAGSVGGTYTTTTGIYVLLSLLAGWVFFDEPVAPLALLGAAGIMAGVYLLNGPGRISSVRTAGTAPAVGKLGPPSSPHAATSSGARERIGGWIGRRKARLFTGLGLGAATAVLWTLGLLVLKWGLERSDVITAAFMRNVVASAVYVGIGLAARWTIVPRAGRSDWSRLLLSAGFFAGSVFLWNYALANTAAGKTAVLASIAPVFALLMAVGFLHERLSRLAVLGAAVAVGGTLLVVVAK